jgi:hypothetical protein
VSSYRNSFGRGVRAAPFVTKRKTHVRPANLKFHFDTRLHTGLYAQNLMPRAD